MKVQHSKTKARCHKLQKYLHIVQYNKSKTFYNTYHRIETSA